MEPKTTRKSGFSLVEIMISTGIFTIISSAILTLSLFSHRAMFVNTEKLKINENIRNFTDELTRNARSANHFIIYRSFAAGDRASISDRLYQGRTGDMLVLVYLRPYPDLDGPPHIYRLLGYVREDDGDGNGPVKRFDIRYPTGQYKNASTTTVESLLPAPSTISGFTEVIQLSRGLADGNLFYNFQDRSIMIKGEIIHGNKAKSVTETYNFTVSPRG